MKLTQSKLRQIIFEEIDPGVKSLRDIFHHSLELNSDHKSKSEALDAIQMIEDHLNLRGRAPIVVSGNALYSDSGLMNLMIDDFETKDELTPGKIYHIDVGRIGRIKCAWLQGQRGDSDNDIWIFKPRDKNKIKNYITSKKNS